MIANQKKSCCIQISSHSSRSGDKRKIVKAKVLLTLFAIFAVVIGVNFAGGIEAYGSNTEMTVIVRAGDTLWSIAEKHYPKKDIREAVYRIQQINGLKSANLQTGTELKLPAF